MSPTHEYAPLSDGRFGDVFQKGSAIVLWLDADRHYGTWTGIKISDDGTDPIGLREDWVADGWKFVEHIEPYATGGVLPATELGGLTYKAAMELTVADFDKIKVSLRKLSTPELAAAFVKIKDAGS